MWEFVVGHASKTRSISCCSAADPFHVDFFFGALQVFGNSLQKKEKKKLENLTLCRCCRGFSLQELSA